MADKLQKLHVKTDDLSSGQGEINTAATTNLVTSTPVNYSSVPKKVIRSAIQPKGEQSLENSPVRVDDDKHSHKLSECSHCSDDDTKAINTNKVMYE